MLVTAIGTPQGNSGIPLLLTVYLEIAFRGLQSRLPMRPPADDIDFISSCSFLNHIERINCFRHADQIDQEWKMTRKLGSLFNDAEDIACRKQTVDIRRLQEVVDSVTEATEDQPAPSTEVLRVVCFAGSDVQHWI